MITAGSPDTALQHARRMKLVGLGQVKLKVGFDDDVPRIHAVREALGPSVSLRLDANGAWTLERALEVLQATAGCDIAAAEQPLPRAGRPRSSRSCAGPRASRSWPTSPS